jgi:hypothetical protein
MPLRPQRTRHKKSFNPMLYGESQHVNELRQELKIITKTILTEKYQC